MGENEDLIQKDFEEEKRYGIKKDIESLVKLLSILVYKKEIKIYNQDEYKDFVKKLTHYNKILEINFEELIEHPFLQFRS